MGYEDERLAVSPIGPLDRHAGFSFNRYLDYLSAIDIETGNTHHRPQWHGLEATRKPDIIIDISRQDLYTELNRIAPRFGLPAIDFGTLDFLHALERRRSAKPVDIEGNDIPDRPFNRAAAAGRAPWPKTEQFLTAPVRRRIETLYAVDFANLVGRVAA
jgi:hypothetical protein